MSDNALKRACYVLRVVLADRKDLRHAYYHRYGRVAVIPAGHKLTEIPEYSRLAHMPAYDAATPGLGAIRSAPVSTAKEANVLCIHNDTDHEDIMLKVCLHVCCDSNRACKWVTIHGVTPRDWS